MNQNNLLLITEEEMLETIKVVAQSELLALIQKEKNSLFVRFLDGQRFKIIVKEEKRKVGLLD